MNFKEKIDKLLEVKAIALWKLAELGGVKKSTLEKAYDRNGELRPPNLDEFLQKLGVNPTWWETGEGQIILPKAELARPMDKETFYKNLIEENNDYSLIPRAVLRDYKIVPDKIIDVIIDSNRNEKNAITKSFNDEKDILIMKYEMVIEGLENKIRALEAEKEILKRQIPLDSK